MILWTGSSKLLLSKKLSTTIKVINEFASFVYVSDGETQFGFIWFEQ